MFLRSHILFHFHLVQIGHTRLNLRRPAVDSSFLSFILGLSADLLRDGLGLELEFGFVLAEFGRMILVLLALVCRFEVRGVECVAHLAIGHVVGVAPPAKVIVCVQDSGSKIWRRKLLIDIQE